MTSVVRQGLISWSGKSYAHLLEERGEPEARERTHTCPYMSYFALYLDFACGTPASHRVGKTNLVQPWCGNRFFVYFNRSWQPGTLRTARSYNMIWMEDTHSPERSIPWAHYRLISFPFNRTPSTRAFSRKWVSPRSFAVSSILYASVAWHHVYVHYE